MRHPIHAAVPALFIALALSAAPMPAAAAQPEVPPATAGDESSYAIAAGPLAATLLEIARHSGRAISVDPALVHGLDAPAVSGRFSVEDAVRIALAGRLELIHTANGTLTVRQPAGATVLPALKINADANASPITAYAGGQIARGARLGVLGNADFMRTPFAVQGYTADFIDSVQARSVSDVIKYDPSVQPAQSSPNMINDVFYIRGFQTHAGRASFDGMPNLLNRMLPFEAVERVELFKGPSAFLNGRPDAVGGTVNLVPKRAADTPLTRVGIQYETSDVLREHVDIGRRFGENNAWGVRVNGAYADGETATEPSLRRSSTGAIALDYRGDTLRFALDHVWQRRKQLPSTGESVQLNAGVPVPRAPDGDAVFGQPWSEYNRTLNLSVARLDWDFAPGWTASLAYGHSDDDERSLAPQFRAINANGDITNTAMTYTEAPIVQDSAQLIVAGEFATGAVGHRISVGAGRTEYDQRNFRRNTAAANAFASNLYAPVYYARPLVPAGFDRRELSETFVTGFFISDELSLFDERMLLTLGLRSTRIETDGRNLSTGVRITDRYDQRETTPMVGLVVRARDNLSLYANYIEALEQGGTAPVGTDNAGHQFEPLVAKQVEAGFKLDLGRLALTLGVFEIEKANEYLDIASSLYSQDGRQVNRGIELNAFGELAPGLRLLAGATWLDAETERTGSAALDGNTALGVPEHTVAARLEWDPSLLPGATFALGAIHVGEQYYDAENVRELPSWTRLDAGASYRFALAGRDSTLRFAVENLADKNYWQHNDRGRLWLASPRTVLLSLTTDF